MKTKIARDLNRCSCYEYDSKKNIWEKNLYKWSLYM